MSHQSNIPADEDPAYRAQIAALKEMTAILNAADYSRSNSAGRSISDDDLCASCKRCDYRAGELSFCLNHWPDVVDDDGYFVSCSSYIVTGT